MPDCRAHPGGVVYLVGCAPGIDARIGRTCAILAAARTHTFVACAFEARAAAIGRTGVFASVVVPGGVSTRAALRRRTLWMVKRAVLLVLFPDDPATGHWERGSGLAFRAAVDQLKPVFVVTAKPPAAGGTEADGGCLAGGTWRWGLPRPQRRANG